MSEFKELSRSVKGSRVLVTGAASGMGVAPQRVFAAEGAHVAATDFNGDGRRQSPPNCEPRVNRQKRGNWTWLTPPRSSR